MRTLGLLLLLGTVILPLASAQPRFTYPDLVRRLTDLEHLAKLPAPGETTKQWSSYDRASKYDEPTGKYIHWDANGDGGGIIRTEGNQSVFAEMEGPGCLWRIWSATVKEGHVRIYLDGATAPAVDLPFTGYFDGKHTPFTRPMLVHTTTANGYNNYTPIPYQQSCKIVADPGWGQYYQFVYTTFPKGTQVPTFTRELSPVDSAALDEADRSLRNSGPRDPGTKYVKSDLNGPIRANGSVVADQLAGPRAITLIRAKVDLPAAPADRDVLRELALQIRWEGETSPSVWVPFGDFFGTAPGANPYRAFPCGLTEDGWWYANWYMPFGQSAEVKVINEGKVDRKLKLEIYHEPLPGEVAQFGRFHAKWHRDQFLPAEPERAIDWPMLKTTGRGRFVGVMLHIWSPRGGWWGEGDEKFFVDGEKFPSTFGTGSEDYFGYAWSSPTLFFHPLHNQTFNSGNCKGHISVNRFHIADQIPFQKSFEADIEKYYANAKPAFYASTVYWYLAPDGRDPYQVVPVAERANYYVQPVVQKVPGVIEGEALKVLAKTGGNPQAQDMTGFGDQWSGDAHLWWTDARPGDRLELALPVEATGRYDISAQLTKARDYGIVQLWLDGKKLGDPIDLYDANVVPLSGVKLGRHDLATGQHKLTLEITGANAKAVPSYMFGLDYVKLVPIK
ncbi:MAG: DUF2961 domain-containing protein [Verrucomicrobia subdivision 3 bacterium]|nr:DUF2961 domain-containing protein [Limisphaerales bacterium]